MKKLFVMIVVLACVLTAVPLAASISVFSNFGAGDSYDGGPWQIVNYPGYTQMVACQFSPSVNCTLDGIDFAAYWFSGNQSVLGQLLSDSAGLPDQVLESYTISGLTSSPQILTAVSISNPSLSAGQTYWFLLMAEDGFSGWNFNTTDNSTVSVWRGTSADSWQYGDAWPPGAFRVNATPVVPEPSGLMMLLGGLPLTAIMIRRRSSGD